MVTDRLVKDALLPFKRCPFARQKGTFYNAKGHLLECKRASIEMLMCIYYYKIGFYLLVIWLCCESKNVLGALPMGNYS